MNTQHVLELLRVNRHRFYESHVFRSASSTRSSTIEITTTNSAITGRRVRNQKAEKEVVLPETRIENMITNAHEWVSRFGVWKFSSL